MILKLFSKKMMNKVLVAALVASAGLAPVVGPVQKASAETSPVVTFNDSNLQQAVCDALGLPAESTVTQADMQQLTSLYLYGVHDLTGLEYATNLTTFIDTYAALDDISFLGNLTQLKQLALGGNNIQDISVLGNLTDLEGLDLGGNQITDISVLANLHKLYWLNISSNQISDIHPIFAGGSFNNATEENQKSLYMVDNPLYMSDALMQDLRSLNRQWVDFAYEYKFAPGYTPPVDVQFHEQALELKVRHDLFLLPSEPVTPTDMEKLTTFMTPELIHDLTGLEYATNMETLYASSNMVSSIAPLASMTKLKSLQMQLTDVSDLSPLSGLTSLQLLEIDGSAVGDLAPLNNLSSLQKLYLGQNAISDLTPLSNLTGLQELDLGSNQISDLSPLAGLTNLHNLTLWNNQIHDIHPLVVNEQNGGFHGGDSNNIYLNANPLDASGAQQDLQTLQGDGISVVND